jgi:CBS domain-containing protein
MKVSEALDNMVNLPYLAISGESCVEEIAEKISTMRHIRGIYVVDDQGLLQGYVSLGVLIRNVMDARYKPHFHARSLLDRITCEKVADIMERHLIYARQDDDLKKVLDRMVHHNIKQIPVVDEEQRIIVNVGILDLWKLVKESGPTGGWLDDR